MGQQGSSHARRSEACTTCARTSDRRAAPRQASLEHMVHATAARLLRMSITRQTHARRRFSGASADRSTCVRARFAVSAASSCELSCSQVRRASLRARRRRGSAAASEQQLTPSLADGAPLMGRASGGRMVDGLFRADHSARSPCGGTDPTPVQMTRARTCDETREIKPGRGVLPSRLG